MSYKIGKKSNEIPVNAMLGKLAFLDTVGSSSITENWVIKTSAYTSVASDAIAADTTSSAFTITLPASPALGDKVIILDAAGTFATNNLTIGRNGEKIQGLSEDMVVSINSVTITLLYVNSTLGWRIVGLS